MPDTFLIDTSVILVFYFPEEVYKEKALKLLRDYIDGKVNLVITTLTWYEILNAISCLLRGIKGKNISMEQAKEIVSAIEFLDLEKKDIFGLEEEILEATIKYQISAYDASYLVVAKKYNYFLITADKKLYNSLKKDFSFVKFIEDY